MSIARAVLVGTIDQEPEKRFTPQNIAVTSFWISVPGKLLPSGQPSPASKVKVTCWRGMAETAGQLQKGQTIMVEGKLTLPSYQEPAGGVPRKHFEVEVSALSVLPGGLPTPLVAQGSAQQSGGQASFNAGQPAAYASAPMGNATPPQQGASYGTPSGSMDDDLYTVEDIPF
jgi:single-strand DNA-binding protein